MNLLEPESPFPVTHLIQWGHISQSFPNSSNNCVYSNLQAYGGPFSPTSPYYPSHMAGAGPRRQRIGSFTNTSSSDRPKDTCAKQCIPPGAFGLAPQFTFENATCLVHLLRPWKEAEIPTVFLPSFPYTTGRNEAEHHTCTMAFSLQAGCNCHVSSVLLSWTPLGLFQAREAQHLWSGPQPGPDLELRWQMTWRPVNEF